jgi:hypothetical protein
VINARRFIYGISERNRAGSTVPPVARTRLPQPASILSRERVRRVCQSSQHGPVSTGHDHRLSRRTFHV